MLKMKYLMALLMIAALGYLAAMPYITVNQIREAADRHDSQALAEHVEFDSVRQSLKDQLNTRLLQELGGKIKTNPFAALGAAFTNMMVDGLVDTYMTPAGIEQLMRGETPAPGIPNRSSVSHQPQGDAQSAPYPPNKPFADARMGYASLNTFVVTMKDENEEEAKFILRRRGLEWKLTEILLPLD
ncbi:DUF2939 domain-containing protein [Zobellella maritima]|uniref:DUF2939 domain-containing protein n=1 Tax=Zobellella maritima TaxID=2059725 RepID=UPI000E30AE9E|nr:DUF2939 domain-containing protein [Zobellella maritima]